MAASTLADLNVGASFGGQYIIAEYNYIDKVDGIVTTYGIGPIVCKYNYDEMVTNTGIHNNGCIGWLPGLAPTGLTPGATYTSPNDIQDANTILYNFRGVNGTQNGCSPTGCVFGGGDGSINSFATNGSTANKTGGFYTTVAYVERENNILVTNVTYNNNGSAGGFYPGTRSYTTGQMFYFDTQGSINPGPYPGSVQSWALSGTARSDWLAQLPQHQSVRVHDAGRLYDAAIAAW